MKNRTIQLRPGFEVDMGVQSDVVAMHCLDSRLRAHHKLLLREGLGLGKRPEEYTLLQIYGGAAVLAHPSVFLSEVNLVRTSLEIASRHFGTTRLVAIGHERCLRMGSLHEQLHGYLDNDHILEDMLTVRRMFNERDASSECPVRKMFAQFDIKLDVILMKFPTGDTLDYVVID